MCRNVLSRMIMILWTIKSSVIIIVSITTPVNKCKIGLHESIFRHIAMTPNCFGIHCFLYFMYRWKYNNNYYYYHYATADTIVCMYFYFILLWKLRGMNWIADESLTHYSIYFLSLFYLHFRHFIVDTNTHFAIPLDHRCKAYVWK